MYKPLAIAVVLLGVLSAAVSPGARAQPEISLYAGDAWAQNGNLKYEAPGGTALELHDVSWHTDPFTNPIYYGARLTYWLDAYPRTGIALDFTHAKISLDTADRVSVTGLRAGSVVNAVEPVSNTLQSFSNTHGLNLLTLNMLYRLSGPGEAGGPLWWFQPYAGVGLGVALPHVEADINGRSTGEYQYGGPVAQALVGVRFFATAHLGVFGEYKFDYAHLSENLAGGGSVSTDTRLHQLVFGLVYSF